MKLFLALGAILHCAVGCRSTDMTGLSDIERPFLGNSECPMTGEIAEPTASLEYEGQFVYFCCEKCVEAASADPAGAYRIAYSRPQPVGNAMCPVSGRAAGEASVTWQGHVVGLCCAECEGPFEKKAAVYTAEAVMTTR